MENIVFAGIIGLVVGLFVSYYDKRSGSKLYKKWYNVSNKNKIDPKLEIGFVTNQLFGQKLTVGLIFTAIAYVVHFFILGEPFLGLFRMIGFFVGIMVAFYTAGIILSMFSNKVSKTIEYIEKVEKEGIDLKEEAKKGFDKAKEKVKETISPEEKPTAKEEVKEEPISDSETKEDDNWRDGVKKFMDK